MRVEGMTIAPEAILVSFDMASLYTLIPQDEQRITLHEMIEMDELALLTGLKGSSRSPVSQRKSLASPSVIFQIIFYLLF